MIDRRQRDIGKRIETVKGGSSVTNGNHLSYRGHSHYKHVRHYLPHLLREIGPNKLLEAGMPILMISAGIYFGVIKGYKD
ncbi:MAG: hypothetical protein WC533_04415 [Candidatus Pacearchaeota archaeon]